MDSKTAQTILEHAVQAGLLPSLTLEQMDPDQNPAELLETLIQNGSLSEASLEALIQSKPEPTSPLAGKTSGQTKGQTAENKPAQTLPTLQLPGNFSESNETTLAASKSSAPTLVNSHAATPSPIEGRSAAQEFSAGTKVGHYEIVKLLGEGGMGCVYQAFDPLVKRHVALKFLLQNNQSLVQRLLIEARAQARINHPNICKVYEVGLHQGRYFIAMQYLPGQTLNRAMKGMSLEQKVKIMAEVAETLHAAHQEGVIHRDIKPHNLIVEKMEDGSHKPYVMDFGLAREVSSPGVTMTGALLGTPAYMSPEQAQGTTDNLDRRSDVFSLGATMYHLLTGKQPFGPGPAVQILFQVMTKDPTPLRQVTPSLPQDLQTIVMKCLEKEPGQRYESALALASDLRRYLAGEPIVGTPVSSWQRLSRKVRKHKLAVSLVGAACLFGLTLAGFGLFARWQAEQQTMLAARLGAQVKDIETIMRHGHMLPRHNIEREERMVQEYMNRLTQTMTGLGSSATGPGNYALGRGYLALGKPELARKHLELAWNGGFRQPETAYALGITYGTLFQKRLEEVKQITNPDFRRYEEQKAEKELKMPALQFLQTGRAAVQESSEYGEALMAFYEKQWDQAQVKAEQAFQKIPWLYEALRLKGQVCFEQATEFQTKGEYQKAQEKFEQARILFQETVALAPSDAETFYQLTELSLRVAKIHDSQGNSPEKELHELLNLSQTGLEVAPKRCEFRLQSASAWLILGVFQQIHGTDPALTMQHVQQETEQVVCTSEMKAKALTLNGKASKIEGDYKVEHGEDPTPWLDQSLKAYQQAVELDPTNYAGHSGLAETWSKKGEHQLLTGVSPLESYDRAIALFQKAASLTDNQNTSIMMNLGITLLSKAEAILAQGENPTTPLNQGVEQFRKVLHINPNQYGAHINLANTLSTLANYQMTANLDPTATLNQSIEHYQKGLTINPNSSIGYNNLGLVYELSAQHLLARKQSPLPMVDKALESFQASIKINQRDAIPYVGIGKAYTTAARYLLNQDKNPLNAVTEGLAALKQAQDINPALYATYQQAGRLHLAQAEWALSQKTRAVEPSLKQAQQAFQKTMELTPDDTSTWVEFAEMYKIWANWLVQNQKPAQVEIRAGLAACTKVITTEVEAPVAFFIQGEFQVLSAKQEKQAAQRLELLRKARQSFAQSLTLDPSRKEDAAPFLSEITKQEAETAAPDSRPKAKEPGA